MSKIFPRGNLQSDHIRYVQKNKSRHFGKAVLWIVYVEISMKC